MRSARERDDDLLNVVLGGQRLEISDRSEDGHPGGSAIKAGWIVVNEAERPKSELGVFEKSSSEPCGHASGADDERRTK